MTDNTDAGDAGDRVVIKKYANRRLYNTASSSYVTLEHLSDMVKGGVDFVVYDAKTGENITRSVLTQIIFEEENRTGAQNLLPVEFLRQLISFYGDQMQSFLPSYLEMSLASFAKQQERMRSQFTTLTPPGIGAYDETIRQNMVLFERAMKMFTPFAFRGDEADAAAKPEAPPAQAPASNDSLDELKKQVEAMRAQIDKLANKS
jgi:polyhydroxyalkanoate synthesis repressor PhaR